MLVLTIVGARPQFIKAAAISERLRRDHREVLLHTGQHYDENMSEVFFAELPVPRPDEQLNVGSGSHAEQTARMLMGIEAAVTRVRPDLMLVYGDTNSTLAGSLAAAKSGLPIAHIEAGMRSFDRRMPEEVNRRVTDTLSDLLFCSSDTAAANLRHEGITRGVHVVGDVMADLLRRVTEHGDRHSPAVDTLGLVARRYILATIHRAGNTDDPDRLASVMRAFARIAEPIVLPLHPRTKQALTRARLTVPANVRTIEPIGYADMIALMRSARVVLTDSGGVQKEAYWLGVPCVTVRDETEWIETVETGWNRLVAADPDRIVEAIERAGCPATHPMLYGDGHAAERIVEILNACAR